MRAGWRRAAGAAVALGALLIGGSLAPSAAKAGEILTWNFSTLDLFVAKTYAPSEQPVSFLAQDSNLQDHEVKASAGLGLFSSQTPTSMRQVLSGLGVCPTGDPIIVGCPQVDTIGFNEFIRLELDDSIESIDEVRLGLVTTLVSNPDTVLVLGADVANPTPAEMTELLNGSIMDLGTEVGLFTYDVPLEAAGYKYLFFSPNEEDNDGFSIITVTGTVPEPAGLALFGVGLAGLGAVRRRIRPERS